MSRSHDYQPKAILLGAFDRFNYGDLLFPIIVKKEIQCLRSNIDIEIHALIQSDLSRYGALKTLPLRSLYKGNTLCHDDAVIFAGGGTIGVDWLYMYSNLLGKFGNHALYYLKRVLGNTTSNALGRYYFGATSPFPWVAGPEDFPVRVKIAYNAIGGSEFANLTLAIKAQTLACLEQASYLSVRDAETKRLFSPVEDHISVELAPDSAILMSEQFPVTRLEELSSKLIDSSMLDGRYVCLQANVSYVRKHADDIASALEGLYEAHGLRAVLLPIGRYVGLDDHIALRSILTKVRTPAELAGDELSLWEIMLTIARAQLFIGTSLHGNITSQSFEVPHVGLSDRPCKLDYYLATWALPEFSQCVALCNIVDHASEILAIPKARLQNKRTELLALSHMNFSKMAHACGLV